MQPHAFLCRAARHWVILDVSRDSYLCVDRRQFEALGPWLHGWDEKLSDGPSSGSAPPDEAIALANKLLSLGILSERAERAKPARQTEFSLPTQAVDYSLPEHARGSVWTRVLAFFLDAARASRQLRDQPFESTVAFVRSRKERASPARPFDLEPARSTLSAFDSLRLFYPRPYLCLFDSLALIHFLARFGLYPHWVFGVRADPFEAHCWVQAGSAVLNDTLERVSAFTPIMYV